MMKKNAFADLMTDQPPTVASAVEPERPPLNRGRGRPRTPRKGDIQVTTIRLDADDHLAVRTLALRDGMTMNELIQVALRDYCQKRGVKI